MIERYSLPKMKNLWELENKYRLWLKVELAATDAWVALGKVPAEAAAELKARADFSVERILEIESVVRHDVIAFTQAVAEKAGESAKYLHYGLTSTDVVDTAFALQLVEAADLLLADVDLFLEVLKKKADEERHTVMIGRTHGIHAEPITFGLKFALWYQEMLRNRVRLVRAREAVRVTKISGAVGTYAHIDPQVEVKVAAILGLKRAFVATQTLQRDRHAEYMTTLAIMAGTIDKIATEIRGLQKTEVREVEEPFRKGQKGSSAMPHKRNPVTMEQMSGLSRVIRGNAQAALENMALWHERDISHSSVERIIFPDSTILLDYMFNNMIEMISGLHIYRERMLQNMNLTGGLIYSQRVLLGLVEAGLMREEAYKIMQSAAMASWNGQGSLLELLWADEHVREHMSRAQLESFFEYESELIHVDEIIDRALSGHEEGE